MYGARILGLEKTELPNGLRERSADAGKKDSEDRPDDVGLFPCGCTGILGPKNTLDLRDQSQEEFGAVFSQQLKDLVKNSTRFRLVKGSQGG